MDTTPRNPTSYDSIIAPAHHENIVDIDFHLFRLPHWSNSFSRGYTFTRKSAFFCWFTSPASPLSALRLQSSRRFPPNRKRSSVFCDWKKAKSIDKHWSDLASPYVAVPHARALVARTLCGPSPRPHVQQPFLSRDPLFENRRSRTEIFMLELRVATPS